MSEGDASQEIRVDRAAEISEITELAQLAFASRELDDQQSLAARNLVFLSPDTLDMDLGDPLQRDFGDYELLEKIGQGGMGVVYRAHQRSLDREVALKLLLAGPWASAEFVERFQLEAQSAARLEHPNIVTVYEAGSRHALHYFSMRLVRGEALSTALRRGGPLPAREAARMLHLIAAAVDYAHRLGVLHLDLKPANVLVDSTGEPLVADFGLARRLDHALGDTSGEVAGTPAYMAPEQADPTIHPLSIATDIYGLGCILYEMLCARSPFFAGTAQETLGRVLREELDSPRTHGAETPRDLEAICLKCLRKNPRERYASAALLAEDLHAFLGDRPVSVRRPPPVERLQRWIRREPRFAAAVAGVAAALLIGLGATFQQWQRAEDSAFESLQLIWEGRREAALQLEQDGRGHEARERLLANLREQEAAGELDQAALERLRIGVMLDRGARLIDAMAVADARPMAPRLSPDGHVLAIAFNDLTVRWYDTETLEERGRVSLESSIAPGGVNGAWRTSDGQRRLPQLLRFVDDERLLVTLEWIYGRVSPTEADTWLVDLRDGSVVEPPDGFTIAAFGANGEQALLARADGGIELWRTAPAWTRLTEIAGADSQALAWLLAPDGRWAFSLGAGMRGLRRYDLGDEARSDAIDVPGGASVSAWALSGDGGKLAFGTFDGNAYVLDPETRALRQLPGQRGRQITWLEFDEDDAWLAFAEYDGLVQVVDVSAGDLLVGVGMRAGFTVNRVAASRQQRLVVATGAGRTALWRVPESDYLVRPAERIGTAPSDHAPEWRHPADWSLETGLFVDVPADVGGQIHVWRLPPSPSIAVAPAQQSTDAPHGYADRLIDVAYDRVRLASPDAHALTPWLKLPQPPGFAELLDDGRMLLLTVGTQLHAYDASNLAPLYAPVELLASPQRMLASRDGRFVLLSFGEHGDYGHEETLRSFDAVDGVWLPGEAVLDGPIRRYALSPSGSWIVAQGPPLGVTVVLERHGLEAINYYVHDPNEPVASFDFQGDRLLLLTQANPDEGFCQFPASLLSWNPLTNEEQRVAVDGNACVVRATRTGFGVFGHEFDRLVHADGESVDLPRLVTTPVDVKPVAVLSADGRVLARGFRYGAQLHDAVSGEPIGVPFYADISSYDLLSTLQFVDDDRTLRGRSILGTTLQWSMRAATNEFLAERPELSISTREGELPAAAIDGRGVGAAKHRRGADPGPWRRAGARSTIDLARNSHPSVAIPARSADTPPTLLDLSPVYNQSPWEFRNTFFYAMWGMSETPLGAQRIGGVDFDIRGMVQLGLDEGVEGRTSQHIECLPVPAIPIAAVRILAHNGLDTPANAGEPLAELTLRYEDGTVARSPLRAALELKSYGFDDSLVPAVFATHHRMWSAGGRLYEILAPTVVNPQPARPVRCLDLSWIPRSGSSLQIFAITVEPATTNPL